MTRKTAGSVAILLALGVVIMAACGKDGRADRPGCSGSTVSCTLGDPRGVGELERRPGEPLVDRTDLAGTGRVVRSLAVFAQISDIHITDEESPLRVEVIDRRGDRSPRRAAATPHQ